MTILVTGGAGFIGSALVRHLLAKTDAYLVVVDKLTYAGDLRTLEEATASPRFSFEHHDIADRAAMTTIFTRHRPEIVMNLAAETHVDRSIDGSAAFVQTNIVGTHTLLETALAYWRGLPAEKRAAFRFHHISTDEVFGALGADGVFTEEMPYRPNSPYAASKAASDHLVRAWHTTYGLPTIVTNCSNNYGPYQFPEKLIPLMIVNAIDGKTLPIYGKGLNVRDWLFVEDHARALHLVATKGMPGRSYNVGGGSERSNIEVVEAICAAVDTALAREPGTANAQIKHVTDRPGHDFRYAIDGSRLTLELGFLPSVDFETGLARTVRWYLDHEAWWRPIVAERYAGQRMGLAS